MTDREKYIKSLHVVNNKIELHCSLIGCHNSDFVAKKVALSIIHASYPYNDYICENCYNKNN